MRHSGMDQTSARAHAYLFTVRLWHEDLGAGQTEWRGEVHDVVSGERYYFRDWPSLIVRLQAVLQTREPDAPQGSPHGEPN